MRLKGKFALVTGGSEGIGLGFCEAFVREGADLCIVGRSADKLATARRHLGEAAKFLVPAALSSSTAIDEIAAKIGEAGRSLDILVNNAGVARLSPFEKVTAEDYRYVMVVNLDAPFFLTQRLLPHLTKGAASVINISSYFANKMMTNRPNSVYSASKGALNSLTKSLAYELGSRGIRVNAIAPGTVDTPLRRKSVEAMPQEHQVALQKFVESSYPLGHIGKPSDFGGIAVYLGGEESSWVTGGIFSIDGGFTTG